ncbi:hypothetical protein Tco_0453301 [Tanacetum coccineum]
MKDISFSYVDGIAHRKVKRYNTDFSADKTYVFPEWLQVNKAMDSITVVVVPSVDLLLPLDVFDYLRIRKILYAQYNATYCASVEDIAVQYCFFDILLTSLSPRNCIPPEVLLRVSMHSACSTSENALEKPLDIRKLDNSSYQALGACFKPYKAFLKR